MPSFVDHPDMPGALAVQRPDGSFSPPLAPQMAMQADPAGYAAYKAGTGGAASMGAQAGGTPAGVTDIAGPEGEQLRIAQSAGPSMAAPEAYSPAQAAAAAADPFGAPKSFNEPIKTAMDLDVDRRIAEANARDLERSNAEYAKTKAAPPLVMRTDLVGPVNPPAGTAGAVVGKAEGSGTFAPAATGGGPATGNAGAIGLSQYEQDANAKRSFNNMMIQAEFAKGNGGPGRMVPERDQKTGFQIEGARGPDQELLKKKFEGEQGMGAFVPEAAPALELKPKDILEVWQPPKVEAGKDKAGAAVYRDMTAKEREQWAAQWAQRAKAEGLNAATLDRMLDPNLNAAKGRQTGEEIDAFRRSKLNAWDDDLAKRNAERSARIDAQMLARRAEEEKMGGPYGLAGFTLREREQERDTLEANADRAQQVAFTDEQFANAQQAAFNRERDAMADLDAKIKTVSERATTEVDPKRYWKDKSAGEKVLLVLAGMFGGAGAGLAKQPNMAAAAIERSVNDDIDAQKTNIANAKGHLNQLQGLYQDVAQRYGNERAGILAMKSARLGGIENQIRANLATATSEKARIDAERVLALVEQKKRETLVALSEAMNGRITTQFKTERAHMEGGGGGRDMKKVAALLENNREISASLAKDSSGIAKDAASAAKGGPPVIQWNGQEVVFRPDLPPEMYSKAIDAISASGGIKRNIVELTKQQGGMTANTLDKKTANAIVTTVAAQANSVLGQGAMNNDERDNWVNSLTGMNAEQARTFMTRGLDNIVKGRMEPIMQGIKMPDGSIRPVR